MSKIDLSSAPWQECECGSRMFKPVAFFKKVSALISPDGKEHLVPLDLYACDKCGKVPAFLHKDLPDFPTECKAVKKIEGNDFMG